MGRISHTNTTIRCARMLTSKPTPRRCPKRSVKRLGSGGKVLVDAGEDKGMEVTAEFDKSTKWLIC